jgi:predicted enzyme related to lactoylglutathione lyase
MKRVTGLGGLFFKADDPQKLYAWYEKHLGLAPTPDGSCVILPWRYADDPQREGMTVWSIFPRATKYLEPSQSSFMMNFCVEDLDGLLAELQKEGVTIEPKRDDSAFGRFAWIMDPEGNKIELWEPPKDTP